MHFEIIPVESRLVWSRRCSSDRKLCSQTFTKMLYVCKSPQTPAFPTRTEQSLFIGQKEARTAKMSFLKLCSPSANKMPAAWVWCEITEPLVDCLEALYAHNSIPHRVRNKNQEVCFPLVGESILWEMTDFGRSRKDEPHIVQYSQLHLIVHQHSSFSI